MKAHEFTFITKTAKDGKMFHATISRYEDQENEGWSADGDFLFTTKAACIKATKCSLQNQVEDYEYDNNLR